MHEPELVQVLRELQSPLRQYPPQHWLPDEHDEPDDRQAVVQYPPEQVRPEQHGDELEQVCPEVRHGV